MSVTASFLGTRWCMWSPRYRRVCTRVGYLPSWSWWTWGNVALAHECLPAQGYESDTCINSTAHDTVSLLHDTAHGTVSSEWSKMSLENWLIPIHPENIRQVSEAVVTFQPLDTEFAVASHICSVLKLHSAHQIYTSSLRQFLALSDAVLAWLSVWSKVSIICMQSSWCYISSCFTKI